MRIGVVFRVLSGVVRGAEAGEERDEQKHVFHNKYKIPEKLFPIVPLSTGQQRETIGNTFSTQRETSGNNFN